MSYLTDRDRIIPAMTINAPHNTFTIARTKYADTITVTIPEGKYYQYLYRNRIDAPQTFRDAFPSFWETLVEAINDEWNVGGETFTVAAATPTTSTMLGGGGIKLRTPSASNVWEFTGLTDFQRGMFGAYNNTTVVSIVDGSFYSFTSPYSLYGKWISPRRYSSRLGDRMNIQYRNSGNRKVVQNTKWYQKAIRTMRYHHIFANHVSINRNNDATYAAAGYLALPQHEHGNYFGDCWDLMSKGDDFMIVYSEGDEDLWVTSHSEWEVMKLEENDAAALSNCIALNDSNAEIYDITFNAWRMLKTDPLLTFIPAGGSDGWEDIADYYDQD